MPKIRGIPRGVCKKLLRVATVVMATVSEKFSGYGTRKASKRGSGYRGEPGPEDHKKRYKTNGLATVPNDPIRVRRNM